MIKLKLKNALSYNGIVTATFKNPYVTVKTKKEADEIISTGYFEVVENQSRDAKKDKE